MKAKIHEEMVIPINETSCGSCTHRSVKAIRKFPGVSHVEVLHPGDHLKIVFDPMSADFLMFYQTMLDTGLTIPTRKVFAAINGMSCIACTARVEGALVNLSGVIEATASLKKASVNVTFVDGLVSVSEMREAIRLSGYQAGDFLENIEKRDHAAAKSLKYKKSLNAPLKKSSSESKMKVKF